MGFALVTALPVRLGRSASGVGVEDGSIRYQRLR
jgi:hypothetical protein